MFFRSDSNSWLTLYIECYQKQTSIFEKKILLRRQNNDNSTPVLQPVNFFFYWKFLVTCFLMDLLSTWPFRKFGGKICEANDEVVHFFQFVAHLNHTVTWIQKKSEMRLKISLIWPESWENYLDIFQYLWFYSWKKNIYFVLFSIFKALCVWPLSLKTIYICRHEIRNGGAKITFI